MVTIDREKAMGLRLPALTVDIERGRLRFFAAATDQTDPIYSDIQAARSAGHPDLPVPPTFFFSLELDGPEPFAYLTDLGVDMRRILHGEQSFVFHSLAHAGETLTLQPAIVNVYSKKAGALEFLVKRTRITRPSGEDVAEASTVIVVRHPEAHHDDS